MKLTEAKKAVETFLYTQNLARDKRPQAADLQVSIYLWSDDPVNSIGPRVAEVSFWIPNRNGGGAGSSFMQVDPKCAAVCFYVERYILDLLLEESEDELADDRWRLCQAIWEEDPK